MAREVSKSCEYSTPAARTVPFVVGFVVRRAGWQAKATMHALLNDRVVQRPERIVGGTHKTEEKISWLPNGQRTWREMLRIEDLSGIENSLGIKSSLKFADDPDVDFPDRTR